jgi:hypothetical protein
MALRTGHGSGSGTPHIEVLPPDEQPEGIPATPIVPKEGDYDHKPGEPGRLAKGNSLAGHGGKAKKGYSKLAQRVCMDDKSVSPQFDKYRMLAESFRRTECKRLALVVGGGECGPGPSLIVAMAARAAAWSAYFDDIAKAGGSDIELIMKATRLGETSRQHLMAAHELCAKEAKLKPVQPSGVVWKKKASELPQKVTTVTVVEKDLDVVVVEESEEGVANDVGEDVGKTWDESEEGDENERDE